MNHSIIPVITIDGPGGVGKGTVGRNLAHHLQWHFLDSGSIYRALAYAVFCSPDVCSETRELKISVGQALPYVIKLAHELPLEFKATAEIEETLIFLDGKDITQAIRTEECGNNASILAVIPGVRSALLDRQRAFRQQPGLIADGRDMGTVIFPEAFLKIFLTATPLERASRRVKQLQRAGVHVSLETILQEVVARDKRDENRQIAPLRPAPDAVVIDTTTLAVTQVFEQVLQLVNQKLPR